MSAVSGIGNDTVERYLACMVAHDWQGLAATIAKLLLIVFVVLLIVSAFSGALRGRPPI